MRRPRFQFRLSTLLWVMLAIGCYYAGLLQNRRQIVEQQFWIGTLMYREHRLEEENLDLSLGKERAQEIRMRIASERAKRRMQDEMKAKGLQIESPWTFWTWYGSIMILVAWFVAIGIGWLVVIRRKSRQPKLSA
jgi:hypothetical protein